MEKRFGIIEIGSNNTKTHVYEDNKVIYENNTITIINKDNEYIEFYLQSKIDFITPGLNQILGKDYKVEVKRVIYYE